jgi:hypothetical protein
MSFACPMGSSIAVLLDFAPSRANIIEEEIFLYEHNFLNLGAFSFLIESLPNPANFGNPF